MAAGAICVPTIIPLRAPVPGQHKTCIDSNTKIELRSETPGVTIYYTITGQNPELFQKHSPAAKVTMKYEVPFRLPGGRRTVKAIAVSEDGRESFVVTKAFDVEQLEPDYTEQEDDGTRFMNEIPHVNKVKREMAREASKMMTSKDAWAELQKMKHKDQLLNGIDTRKPANGPRFLNHRLGTDRSGIHGGSLPVDAVHGLSSTEVDIHYRNRRMPPDNATQALRLQRETDFLKCVYCFAARPADPYARFCNECGNALQQLTQSTTLTPPEPGQMGTCVHCHSHVPFNTTNCLVCEAPIPPQNQPQAAVKLAHKLVCIACGTGNPANLNNCVTCQARLPITGAPVNTQLAAPMRAREDGRLLTCTKCGRVNNSDARFCDWCGAKPAPLMRDLTCTKCHATNNAYARFCGSCGATVETPQRPDVLGEGITVTQNKTGTGGVQWLPVAVRNPTPKYDVCTQTVGLFYPSNKGLEKNREVEEEKLRLVREMSDKKPVLTAVSPGKGYWRKQIDHICGHIKAHAQNNAEFRALIGEPRMGKVISTAVHEDGYELSLTVNFALRGNKDPFVGERMGYTKRELLSQMTSKASITSYGSQESLVSVLSTARSRTGKKKSARKPKKKVPKENKQTPEDKLLLKELGKNGEGDPHEVEKLIEEGADANVHNKDDFPVLHVAVQNKRHEAIPILVQHGADIHGKGPNRGNTALHDAVSLGYKGLDTIDALLGCGANPNRKNDKGETAYDLAVAAGETEIANRMSAILGQNKLDKLIKTSSTAKYEDSF